MFRDCMQNAFRPVRQIRIAMFNLERLDTQPTLWARRMQNGGRTGRATTQLNEQLGKNALMTGSQLALRNGRGAHNAESEMPVHTAARNGSEFVGRKPP